MDTSLHHNTIKELAEIFWKGTNVTYPLQYSTLEGIAFEKFPINITKLNRLTLSKIYDWFSSHKISFQPASKEDKPLFGLLFIQQGQAFIFLDGMANTEESLFTLAHELAHYVIEVDRPKRLAINSYGNHIEDVFDGNRTASILEDISVITSQITIRPYLDLLEREEMNGDSRIKVWEAESNADALALELIAPEVEVRKLLNQLEIKDGFYETRENLPDLLFKHFRLPRSVADYYTIQLSHRWYNGRPSFGDWLGI